MFETGRLADIPPGPGLMTRLGEVDPAGLDEVAALGYAAAMERMKSYCDAQRYTALATFAEARTTVPPALVPGAARLVRLGGEGTPAVDEFATCEYAATAHLQDGTARAHLAVALDLRHRLPGVLAMLRAGLIPGWRATMVAEATRHLSIRQVALAQARIMPILAGLGAKRLAELVRQVVIDTDPDGAQEKAEDAKDRRHVSLDPEDDNGLVTGGFCADADDALRFAATVDRVADWLAALGDTDPKPARRAKALGYLSNPHQMLDLMTRATGTDGTGSTEGVSHPTPSGPWPEVRLYVHLTRDQWAGTRDGAATLEGVGPITLAQARDILGHAHVRVQPVIDLDGMPSSDDRFVRGRMREAVVLKNPHCPFPYCSRSSRRSQGDHTVPWPTGTTSVDNLSPPDTKHHRAKTHAGWHHHQPVNGIYVWVSPHGRVYVVDHRGVTHDLGRPPAA
jgi:Domain of unknown function (DUF222)